MTVETSSGGRRLVLEEAALRAQLQDLRAERARLDARERVVLGALDLFERGVGDVERAESEDILPVVRSVPSQRDMIKAVLSHVCDEAGKVSVSEMIAAIHERFGVELARTSVSPTLAKMEAAGEVDHVGRKWRLAVGSASADGSAATAGVD
jgi:hypothetical protein